MNELNILNISKLNIPQIFIFIFCTKQLAISWVFPSILQNVTQPQPSQFSNKKFSVKNFLSLTKQVFQCCEKVYLSRNKLLRPEEKSVLSEYLFIFSNKEAGINLCLGKFAMINKVIN